MSSPDEAFRTAVSAWPGEVATPLLDAAGEDPHAWWLSHWPEAERAAAERAWATLLAGGHRDLLSPSPLSVRTRDRWVAQIEQAQRVLDADPRDHLARGAVGEATHELTSHVLAPEESAGDGGARARWVLDVRRERLQPAAPLLPIRTERLLLRPVTAADAAGTHAYYGDPVVAEFLLMEPQSLREVEAIVAERGKAVAPREDGRALCLAVEHEGQVVGDVMLRLSGPALCQAELGWAFAPAHQRRGFATEAASALLHLAFGHYAMWRVFANLDARNTRSAALCERIGLRRELDARADYWSKGRWTPSYTYAAYADTWSGGAAP